MDIKEIKRQLPHGAIREIAKRAKVTEGLVSRILSGKIEKSNQEPEILKATATYLKEYKVREKEAHEALEKAMTN